MVEMGNVDTTYPYHIICSTDGIALYPSCTSLYGSKPLPLHPKQRVWIYLLTASTSAFPLNLAGTRCAGHSAYTGR